MADKNNIIDGENGDEPMGPGYDDSNGPNNGGGDQITNSADLIYGNDGNDDIDGGGGDDTIFGDNPVGATAANSGNDNIDGGAGNDEIDGGFGNDTIDGGTGDDTIYASAGTDQIDGSDGRDTYDAQAQGAGIFDPGNNNPNAPDVADRDPSTHELFGFRTSGGGGGGDDDDDGATTNVTNVLNVSDFSASADGSGAQDFVITDGWVAGSAGDDDDGSGSATGSRTLIIDGNGGDAGDGDNDIFRFDLSGFDDDFTVDMRDSDDCDQLVFTDVNSRTDNPDGTVTLNYTGSDGQGHTVNIRPGEAEVLTNLDSDIGGPNPGPGGGSTLVDGSGNAETIIVNVDDEGDGTVQKVNDGTTDTVESVENFVAGESPAEADQITLTDAIDAGDIGTEIQGLSDNAVGTFTPAGGGSTVAFGPSESVQLSDILNGSAPAGSYQITDGDEDGQVGNISFENFETINFTVTGTVSNPDGVVDGEESGEVMNPGYNDNNDPTDGGGDIIDGDDGLDDSIRGNGGNDTIDAGLGDDTVDGGTGDDVIYGNEGDDTLDGGEGNDTIDGGDGSDVVDDQDGDNVIDTSSDNPNALPDEGFPGYGFEPATNPDDDPDDDRDSVTTGDGNDSITTGDDRDTIQSGGGDDTIDSGIDNDLIDGGDGADDITAGEGRDTVLGGEGNDTIVGGLGPDVTDPTNIDNDDGPFGPDPLPDNDRDSIDGGGGDDVIFGEDDDDTLIGGTGNDSLDGGIDDDSLDGGAGNDTLEGGLGDDTIKGGDGSDVVVDTDGDNVIDTSATDPTVALPDRGFDGYGFVPSVAAHDNTEDDRDRVTTGDGNDSITTGDDRDTIQSGGGDDTIDSGIDDDLIDAGDGEDEITAGEGNDTVLGGDGDDSIYGGLGPLAPDGTSIDDDSGPFGPDPDDDNGRDSLDGGAGDDRIFGEDDDDTLIGGTGDDTLDGGIDDDVMTGGAGDDVFIEVDGDGADTITDFGVGESGPIDDDNQTNNDFIDLSTFFNEASLANVNNSDADPSNDFADQLSMLRADGEDGRIDGVIDGVDYKPQIGDVDVTLLDGSGDAVKGDDLTFDNTNVACFVKGTLVATRRGAVAIENLKAGDEVITMDHGFQKIRWIGSTSVAAEGSLAPVVIRRGVMGNERDLRVSPQHRMLVRGWHVELMFGQKEALVPAKALINDETVFQLEGGTVEYFHMMFDRHELIYAEGIPSESFHPGHVGLGSFADDTRDEILALFPELREDAGGYSEHARPSLKVREAKVLAENPELMKE